MEYGEADVVVYCDTSTGLPENLDWIREVCAEFGWPLEVLPPKLTLLEFALRYGFPKAPAHLWAMRYFKEHPIEAFAAETDTRTFYSGVYRHESDTRYTRVDGEATDRGTFEYRSPCHDWKEYQFDDYVQDHGLPCNPHADCLGRSPDCYCCAVGSRDEVVIDLKDNDYDRHAEHLLSIEKKAQEEIGTQEDHCWLGSQGLPSKKLRALMAQADEQQTYLCGPGCYEEPELIPATDGGTNDIATTDSERGGDAGDE